MTMHRDPLRRADRLSHAALVVGALLSLFSLLSWAAGDVARAANDVTRWDGDARSAARLVAGSQRAADGALRAGVEIRLKAGWHTYWRYPGDAGVPPKFDFGASQNLRRAVVLWPAPQRIMEAGGSTLGFSSDVIFPIRVEPLDAKNRIFLVQFAIDRGDLSGALVELRELESSIPNEPRTTALLARIQYGLGQTDQARQTIRAVLDSPAANPEVLNHLLSLAPEMGELAPPAEIAKQILVTRPDHVAALDRKSVV